MSLTDEQIDDICMKLRSAFGIKTTDDLVKQMVDRFLCWKLPEDFCPDAGISFKAEYNENTAYPMKHEPIGTNLFNAEQAEQMVKYMLGLNV